MGRAKQEWIISCQRGYDLLETKRVCIECIYDDFLKSYHSEDSHKGKCSFCGRTGVQVTDADRIQEQIMQSIMAEYEDIQDAGAPYESREGGWQIGHEMAQEIVPEIIEEIGAEEFREAIVESIHPDVSWCERDWTILSPIARMNHGWTEFCQVVKHRLRFSFSYFEGYGDSNHPDYTHPSLTLKEIGELIEANGLFKTLSPGAQIFRARISDHEIFSLPDDLGSPPFDRASSNRMSPAGIPMFYGANEIETAISETWDKKAPGIASIGRFRVIKKINIIDFTALPERVSFWSNPGREIFAQSNFLHNLTAELSKPIKRDSKVDLEYAPTQIISEYLTKARYGYPGDFRNPEDIIHGLAFSSSKTSGKNYGLNLLRSTESISWGLAQSEYLELVDVEHRNLTP